MTNHAAVDDPAWASQLRFLENDLVAWAEEHLGTQDEDGGRLLQIYTYEYDVLRQQTLAARSYEKMSYGGMIRHLRLGCQPRPVVELADGYTLRTTRPDLFFFLPTVISDAKLVLEKMKRVAEESRPASSRTGRTTCSTTSGGRPRTGR